MNIKNLWTSKYLENEIHKYTPPPLMKLFLAGNKYSLSIDLGIVSVSVLRFTRYMLTLSSLNIDYLFACLVISIHSLVSYPIKYSASQDIISCINQILFSMWFILLCLDVYVAVISFITNKSIAIRIKGSTWIIAYHIYY